MKTHILTAIIFVMVFGLLKNACAQQPADNHPITYGNGDGSSFDKAIVITGAPSAYIGDLAEYNWLAHMYPGYQITRQSLYYKGIKTYDFLEFNTKDGKQKSIYFDISDFFGKSSQGNNPSQ